MNTARGCQPWGPCPPIWTYSSHSNPSKKENKIIRKIHKDAKGKKKTNVRKMYNIPTFQHRAGLVYFAVMSYNSSLHSQFFFVLSQYRVPSSKADPKLGIVCSCNLGQKRAQTKCEVFKNTTNINNSLLYHPLSFRTKPDMYRQSEQCG